MATGTTRAQELLDATKCDLCDTYKNVSWKCQNCNEILCKQCKKSHLRSKLLRNHIVTELEDSWGDGEGSSIFCPDHEDEAFQMFCTTCDILVCFDCIRGKHKVHDYKKIKEVVKPKQTQLDDTFKQIKTQQIPKLEESLVSITNMQEKYNQDIDRVIAEIKTKGDELKQEITSIQDRLIDKLMRQVKEDTKCLNETKEQLDLRLSALKEQLKQHEEKMKKYTDIDIIAKAASIKDSLTQLTSSIEIPTVKSPNFQIGQVNGSDLENMYGQLELEKPGKMQTERSKPNRSQTNLPDENVKQDQSKSKDTRVIKGNIVLSFTWRENLKKIAVTKQKENEAWMLPYSFSTTEQYLDLVDCQGKHITSIRPEFIIGDMVTTKSGDLLVTAGCQIKRVSRSGSKDVFANFSPYGTYGIHVTQNGDVLVGLCHLCKGSRVTRLSQQGKTKQVIDIKGNDVDMYNSCISITENVNQDIVLICDWDYILVVNKYGRRRFTYRGPPTNIKKIKDFHPSDVICDQSGQILVADTNNSTIHLLDEDGTFLQFILTKQHGIEIPKALAIDHSGRIWVGCKNGKVFIAE